MANSKAIVSAEVEDTQVAQVLAMDAAELELLSFVADEYEKIDNKDELIGKPFFIEDLKFITDKKTNREYVRVEAVDVSSGSKIAFTDGSTGIKDQLVAMVGSRSQDARFKLADGSTDVRAYVKRGLRKSEYETEDAKGNAISATTYYLA